MTQGCNGQKGKKYDLEDRTKKFATDVRVLLREAKALYSEDGRQLIRSSGSVGANYIEANEALSKKDFTYRVHLCRKEAKESAYWLDLLSVSPEHKNERERLFRESTELLKIFSAIIEKTK